MAIITKTFSVFFIALACVIKLAYGHTPLTTFDKPNVVWEGTFWNRVLEDHCQHYSWQGLSSLGLTLGSAGLFANTKLDQSFQDHIQLHIRSKTTNELSDKVDQFTQIRQIRVVIPVYISAMWLGSQANTPSMNKIGKWGERSLRTLFLGAPQQAVLTELLGANRPQERDPHWHWFEHNRGVSGHAFYGAVPLINAAQVSESLTAKSFFYTLSILPALSRVNQNKHYLSQAGLGWGLAFIAAKSVSRVENKKTGSTLKFNVTPLSHGWSVGLHYDF